MYRIRKLDKRRTREYNCKQICTIIMKDVEERQRHVKKKAILFYANRFGP